MKVLTHAVNPAYVHESKLDSVERIDGDIILSVRQPQAHASAQPSIVFSLSEAKFLLARLRELVES